MDREIAVGFGVVVVDCSWEKAADVFSIPIRGQNRRLPPLLPANPVSFGRIGRLSSLEALVAALYILGFRDDSWALLRLFKWAPNFIDLNREPLEAYAAAGGQEEILRKGEEFFPVPEYIPPMPKPRWTNPKVNKPRETFRLEV
jgi:pre-rRNA-processing protein TSR3